MNLLFFGDSITQGFWDVEGGWVARIRKQYDSRRLHDEASTPVIFNLGISGDTSDGVAKRIGAEIHARAYSEVAVVIAVGVNDSRLKNGVERATVDSYRDNLSEILHTTRQYSHKVLFIGLTPCIEERRIDSAGTVTFINERIKDFDATLRDFCDENGANYVPVYERIATTQAQKELLPDGIHPNSEGHQLLADIILPKVEELLR